jgi:hypothetical protein
METFQIPMPRVRNPAVDMLAFRKLSARVEALEKLLAAQGMGVIVEEPAVSEVAEEFIEVGEPEGETEAAQETEVAEGDETSEPELSPILAAVIDAPKRRGRPAKEKKDASTE